MAEPVVSKTGSKLDDIFNTFAIYFSKLCGLGMPERKEAKTNIPAPLVSYVTAKVHEIQASETPYQLLSESYQFSYRHRCFLEIEHQHKLMCLY